MTLNGVTERGESPVRIVMPPEIFRRVCPYAPLLVVILVVGRRDRGCVKME